ncbi:MAG: hypothetical protein ACFE9R_04505, partial [Candidatus Hermodarchaeota archaeon]
MSSEIIDKKYKKAAQIINTAGGTPLVVSDTLIQILKVLVEENHLDFILAFKSKKSQTLEQLRESSKMSDTEIKQHVENLAKIGLV